MQLRHADNLGKGFCTSTRAYITELVLMCKTLSQDCPHGEIRHFFIITFEIFQSIVVQGGSVMYKDHTDQPPQVKRRRSQEKEVPSIPTSSPLKIMKTEPPMSPDNIVVSPGSSSTTDNSSVYHFANSIRFTQFYPEKWLKMTTARLGDIGPPHMTVTADKGKTLFH